MNVARYLLPMLALPLACGSIADPNSGRLEPTQTVSGKLSTSGTALPSGTHVALVWRNGSSLAVGSDAPVVGQAFSISLSAPPPDADFFPYDASVGTVGSIDVGNSTSGGASSGGASPPTSDAGAAPAPEDAGVRGALRSTLRPLGAANGSVGDALTIAVAGFVVYVDGNGDGTLDVRAGSPDRAIGGASDLMLAYLRSGSTLDYQRMADKVGVVPGAGYNLALIEGRWVSLDLVDLTLTSVPQLPPVVCGGVSPNDVPPTTIPIGPNGAGGSSGTSGSSGSVPTTYPAPSDPNLRCAADGRSYTYSVSPTCPATSAPTFAVCARTNATLPCSGGSSDLSALAPGAPVPPGWPCATSTALDAGVENDAGQKKG